jgi:hypothetical protein
VIEFVDIASAHRAGHPTRVFRAAAALIAFLARSEE